MRIFASACIPFCSLVLGVYSPLRANMMETQGFTSGLAVSSDTVYRLESVLGEVSGAAGTGGSKKILSGHSRASHSPGVVYDLAISTLSAGEVRLEWTGVGRDGLVGQASYVEIKIATFPVTYDNYATIDSSMTLDALASGIADQRVYAGLEPGKTYYAALRVRDSANMYGRLSQNGVFSTAQIKPRPPVLLGVLSGSNFTLSWVPVAFNVAGGTAAVKNYEVYSSTSVTGAVSGPVTLSSSTLSYTVSSSPAKWFFVRVLDIYDVRSDASVWLSNSDEMSRAVADDQRAVIDMPKSLGDILSSQGLAAVITGQPQYETGATLSAYNFHVRDILTNAISTRDLGENATLILPLSRNGSVSIASFGPSAAYSAYDYAVYYFNGVEDVKLGGTINPSNGTISILTRKTGLFKVKQVVRAQAFMITQTAPRKTFTPNGDGIWDEFNILYDNPEGLSIDAAKIYDLSGAEVADLKAGSYNSVASLSWDGKKKGGGKAEAGIYIYQFKAGSKYYNGTVVLAR